MSRFPRFALVVVAVCVAACATTPEAPPLTPQQLDDGYTNAARDRAVFDTSCAADQLELTFLGDSTSAGFLVVDRVVGVTGCGQKLVYVARCTMNAGPTQPITAQKCVAIQNGDSKPTATTAPTTAPAN